MAHPAAPAILGQWPDPPRDILRRDNRFTAAPREFVLDAILTALWTGQLSREAAAERIRDQLGMSPRDAQAEVDGVLRD